MEDYEAMGEYEECQTNAESLINDDLRVKVKKKSKTLPQVLATISACLAMMSTGFHSTWPIPSLVKLMAPDSAVLVTSNQSSWIVSFALIGSILGSIFLRPLLDRWGAKTVLLLTSIPYLLSALVLGLANEYWWLYIARLFAGIGNGMSAAACPIYIGEIAESDIRGALSTILSVSMILGAQIPVVIGPWVSRVVLATIAAVIPTVFFLTFVWMPESPYYYAMKNRQHDVKKSLTRLRGTSDVDEEVKIIQKSLILNRNEKGSFFEVFTVKANRKALAIAIGLRSCHISAGFFPIVTYLGVIFKKFDAGIEWGVIMIMISAVKFINSFIVILLADRAGRRPLLLISSTFSAIFLLSEGWFFQLVANGTDVSDVAWLSVVLIMLFFTAYTLGLAFVPMMIEAEIYSYQVKTAAMTIAAIYQASLGVVILKIYQVVTDLYGHNVTFFAFGALNILSTTFIYFVVPETKKRSFIEIQNQLRGGPNASV